MITITRTDTTTYEIIHPISHNFIMCPLEFKAMCPEINLEVGQSCTYALHSVKL